MPESDVAGASGVEAGVKPSPADRLAAVRNKSGGKKGLVRAPRLLSDMRKVYESLGKDEAGLTGAQRGLLVWYKDDPKAFLASLAGLEKTESIRVAQIKKAAAKEAEDKRRAEESGKVKPDEKTERVKDLIREMLRRAVEEKVAAKTYKPEG